MTDENKKTLEFGEELTRLRKRVGELEIYEKFYDRIFNKLRENSSDIKLINKLNHLITEGADIYVVCEAFGDYIRRIINAETSVFLLSPGNIYLIQQNNPLNHHKSKQLSNTLGFELPYLKIPLKDSKIHSTLTKAGLPNLTNQPDVIQLMIRECFSNFKMEENIQQIYNILEYSSILAVPLLFKNEIIGLVEIGSDTSLTDHIVNRLEYIVGLLAPVIKRTIKEKELTDNKRMYREIVDITGIGIYRDNIQGNFIFLNDNILQIFDYSRKELSGKSIQFIIHPDELINFNKFRNAVLNRERAKLNNEFQAIKKSGAIFPVKVEMEPIVEIGEIIGTQTYLWEAPEQLTKRREKIPALLDEDFILKETHHRVKNNMAVISSLLDLQSKSVSDEKVLAVLKESRNRIRSMSLIHEKLSLSTDLSKVNFADYIRQLSVELFNLYNINADLINLNIDIKSTSLDLDYAIPCGLIINELITNSLKYAFEDDKQGEITIKFEFTKNNFVLTFSDNGIGFPQKIDFRKTETMGMQLICTLVEQLEGDIQLLKKKGTVFQITFPITNSSS